MIRAKWMEGYDDISDAIKICLDVFCTEQGMPACGEVDALDALSVHVLVYDDEKPAATGRLTVKTRLNEAEFHIGRIAVLKDHRGCGLGDFVIRLLIRKAYNIGGFRQHVHTQPHLKGFYERYGFTVYGEEFIEDGIPCLSMVREGDVGGNC